MNIKERKKTASILHEWKDFLSENEHDIKSESNKIETVKDLKDLLENMDKEDLNKSEKKGKSSSKFNKVFRSLLDLGVDVSELVVPGASLTKNLLGLVYTIATKTPDEKRSKLSSLSGMDLPENIDNIFTKSSIHNFLKSKVDKMIQNDEADTKLNDINFREDILIWAKNKINKNPEGN